MADGTILTVQEVKDYVPVEHDDDDALIGTLIAEAEANMMSYLGDRLITAAEVTEHHDGGTSTLFLRQWPVDADADLTVTDTQGTSTDATDDETVEATRYLLDPETGRLWRTSSTGMRRTWPLGRRRFKVVYTGGLSAHGRWADVVEPALKGSLRDLVTTWYQLRIAALSSEREGGGIGHSVNEADRAIPLRVRKVWDRYAGPMG